MWKVIPEYLMNRKVFWYYFPVVQIKTYPPNNHPKESPLVKDMTCVRCILTNGDSRWFGTTEAKIGPDLRMHMVINPKDEVLSKWEDSEFFGK